MKQSIPKIRLVKPKKFKDGDLRGKAHIAVDACFNAIQSPPVAFTVTVHSNQGNDGIASFTIQPDANFSSIELPAKSAAWLNWQIYEGKK